MRRLRRLGTTDLRVSALGLACGSLGRELDAEASFRLLDWALQRGIQLLETTAEDQGASEKRICQWLRDRSARQRVVLATKLLGGPSRENLVASVEQSLRRLAVDRIDLLQMDVSDPLASFEELGAVLEELVRAGKVYHIGCCCEKSLLLEQMRAQANRRGWPALQTVQARYSLADRTIEEGLLPWCSEHEIGVLANQPLAGFRVDDTRRPPVFLEDRRIEPLRKLAVRAGCSLNHLALSWVLHRPGVTSVLLDARHPNEIDQALDAWTRPPIATVLARLSELSHPLA